MNLRQPVLAAAMAISGAAVHAEVEFSEVIVFGDSLSDSGTYAADLPEGTGKFTTNPGPVWSENLAEFYGFEITPSVDGGTNYAHGGARVAGLTPVPDSPPTDSALTLEMQIDGYLDVAGAAPNALYSVWGGSNDIFFEAAQATFGAITQDEAIANLETAAGDLVTQIQTLKDAGARHVMVFNLPDSGASPAGVASGQAATLTAMTDAYNAALFGGISAAGMDVIPLDVNGLLTEVIADPMAFGLFDATLPACGFTSALLCTEADLLSEFAPQTFLFADGVHPTTAGHQLISDYAISVVEAPQGYSMLVEMPVRGRELLARSLDRRLSRDQSDRNSIDGFAHIEYQHVGIDPGPSSPGLDTDYYRATVGADVEIREGWVAGGALTWHTTDSRVAGFGGGFETDEISVSGFTGVQLGDGYVNASVTYGLIEYDIRRFINLGSLTRIATANPDGKNVSGAVTGGWRFNHQNFTHGPFVNLLAQKVRVDPLIESGGGSAGMQMHGQSRDSLIVSAGYEVRYNGDRFAPYLQISGSHDSESGDRDVRANLLSVDDIWFTMPAFVNDDSYATAVAGYTFIYLDHLTVDMRYEGSFGQSDVQTYAFVLDIEAAF